MRKIIVSLLTLLMVLNMTGCSSKPKEDTSSSPKIEEAEVIDNSSDGEKQLEQDLNELSAIGDVEVENGILSVSITLPKDFTEGVSQADLDAKAGDQYISAKLNDDGSVTYKFTKAQYNSMLKDIADSIEESMDEMVNDETYAFASIEANKDFSIFDVTLDNEEIGFGESFASIVFFMYGGMYGIFKGNTSKDIVVNYYGASGNLLDSFDSSNMN